MPTYEYRCEACGHEFEEFQSITAAALRKCPSCKKAKLRRLIGTGAGIIFKGSGFYQTDYRSDSYKEAAKKESSSGESKPAEKAATESKAESKPATEAKPAGKPEGGKKGKGKGAGA